MGKGIRGVNTDKQFQHLLDFKGCFKVHGYRLSSKSEIWQNVSIRSCMILCQERSHPYAALHNGSECGCLDELQFSSLQKLAVQDCDIPCMVNENELCGGKNAASLYWAAGSSLLLADERDAGLHGRHKFG